MNLLFVVPDKEKDLGNLEFGGPEQASREDKKRVGRQEVVVQRRYKLFSDVQRADDIEVVILAQAVHAGRRRLWLAYAVSAAQ